MPQKLRAEISNIIPHGDRVYSLILKSEKDLPRFRPGQFLHLALDNYKPGDFWPESRPFSIASSPLERDQLRVTYAVKGVFTTRMENELSVGKSVWIKLPYGEFCIDGQSESCLIAGGTGVTAFTAFLSELDGDHPYPILFCYGVRQADHLIYKHIVEAAVIHCPMLQVRYFIELPTSDSQALPGKINLNDFWSALVDPDSAHFYLSGPPEMITVLKRELILREITQNHIHVDAWE